MSSSSRALCVVSALCIVLQHISPAVCVSQQGLPNELLPESVQPVLPNTAITLLAPEPAAEKVKVTLFMEALCPFCANFVHEQLGDLMTAGFGDIMEMKFVPWGNANVSADGVVQCQHGHDECVANTMISCAMDIHPNQSAWFLFAWCLEGWRTDTSAIKISATDRAESCASKVGWDWTAMQECATGERGKELQEAAHQETAKLQPPHQWVPWLLVNDVPIFEDSDNLKQYLCTAYTGKKPGSCFTVPPTTT